MKKLAVGAALAVMTCMAVPLAGGLRQVVRADEVRIDETTFPDDTFRAYVSEKFDKDKNGVLSEDEKRRVHEIYVSNKGITNLKGVENFKGLCDLYCDNNQLTFLDVSNNTSLITLVCENNQLTKLDVSNLLVLDTLRCNDNKLDSLDVQNNPYLNVLHCYSNKITKLDVSNLKKLNSLYCNDTSLTELNVSGCIKLTQLCCRNASLTTLDVSDCTALEDLDCSNNALTSLNVSTNAALEELLCDNNQLSNLDVGSSANLQKLRCYDNKLTALNLSKNTALRKLQCENNQLKELDVSKNANLKSLYCYDNDISKLDIRTCLLLEKAFAVGDPYVSGNVLSYTGSDGETLKTDKDTELIANLPINATTFPDSAFRNYVSRNFDKNNSCTLNDSEKAQVTSINVSGKGISSLKGVENFTALKELNCSSNKLASLDVSKNVNLSSLICFDNQIENLNVNTNTKLTSLVCFNNRITSLNLRNNTLLTVLSCSYNPISSMDVRRNTALVELYCSCDKLSNLVVSANTKLEVLVCNGNSIASLNIEKCPYLIKAYRYGTKKTGTENGMKYAEYCYTANGTGYIFTINTSTAVTGVPTPTPTPVVLKLNYTEKTLHINQKFQFTVSNANGQKVTWSVGNTSVATVNQEGVVTGKSAANTWLYAKTPDGQTAKCLLKIIDPGTLGINYTEKTIYLGQSFTFKVKNAGILKPTWSVGNTAIATVDSNGTVTTVSAGNTYLYVKTEDGRSARCLVKVVDPGPLNIRYTEKTIKVGATFQFTAKNPAGQTVTWRVGNTAVATVDENGIVTGKSVGNTWLYASTPDGRETRCLLRIVA